MFKQSFEGSVSPWSHPQESFLSQKLPELPTTLREEPKHFTEAPDLLQCKLSRTCQLLSTFQSYRVSPPALQISYMGPFLQKCPSPFSSSGSFPSHPSRSWQKGLGKLSPLDPGTTNIATTIATNSICCCLVTQSCPTLL